MTDDGTTASDRQGQVALTDDGPPPPPGPQQQKPGLGTGAIVGIVAGGIAVLVAIALGVSQIWALIGAVPGQGSGAAVKVKPSAVVTSYLTALSKGDAETALGYLDQAPRNNPLLTDKVLAASNTRAPLTGIKVIDESADDYSADVKVRYLLGGTPVIASYDLYDDGDGAWTISRGLGSIDAGEFDGIGLTVDGQAVDGNEVDVFPGTYELATTLPDFTISGGTVVTVTERFADTSRIRPVLSDAGNQRFRSLVRAAVDACMASTKLAAGCGIDLPPTLGDGTKLVDGTLHRSMSADTRATLDSLKTRPSIQNPTLAQGESIGPVDVTARCTHGGKTEMCDLIFTPLMGEPSIDMAAANPTVLWD